MVGFQLNATPVGVSVGASVDTPVGVPVGVQGTHLSATWSIPPWAQPNTKTTMQVICGCPYECPSECCCGHFCRCPCGCVGVPVGHCVSMWASCGYPGHSPVRSTCYHQPNPVPRMENSETQVQAVWVLLTWEFTGIHMSWQICGNNTESPTKCGCEQAFHWCI